MTSVFWKNKWLEEFLFTEKREEDRATAAASASHNLVISLDGRDVCIPVSGFFSFFHLFNRRSRKLFLIDNSLKRVSMERTVWMKTGLRGGHYVIPFCLFRTGAEKKKKRTVMLSKFSCVFNASSSRSRNNDSFEFDKLFMKSLMPITRKINVRFSVALRNTKWNCFDPFFWVMDPSFLRTNFRTVRKSKKKKH